MPDEVRAPAVDLPDDLINSFLDGDAGKGSAGEEEGTTADETETPGDDETLEEGQLDSEEGGNEDEVGEGDLDDEDEPLGNEEDEDPEGDDLEGETDSETDDDEPEEEETFLSKEALRKHQKEIDKNPHLKAVYKSMQADYVRKTQEVAKVRQEVEQIEAEYSDFEKSLADVTEGGGREMFLVDAALDNPEAFQRAFDRAAELLENPDEQKKFKRERDVEQRAKQIEAKERAEAKRAQAARVQQIHTDTEAIAKDYGIKGSGIDLAKELVAKAILENRASKKHQDVYVTEEQIEAAVKRAAKSLGVVRKDVEQETGRKLRRERQEDLKKTARNSKRRVAPGGKRSPVSTNPKPLDKSKLPKNTDPLDARIDQLLTPG